MNSAKFHISPHGQMGLFSHIGGMETVVFGRDLASAHSRKVCPIEDIIMHVKYMYIRF